MSLSHNRQMSILVVEPDAENRRFIHELLLGDGYGCRAVATAAAARQGVSERIPSLMICEVELGESNGLELYRELSTSAEFPVLFMSNVANRDVIRKAQEAGGTYFVTKPFDPAVLIELVDKSLWMPHLVRRHVDNVGHGLKAPSFGAAATAPVRG